MLMKKRELDLMNNRPYRRRVISSLLSGFGLCISLIVAIGAQNAFILRQAVRREHPIAIAIVCAVSDVILIVAGVAGFGVLMERAPWLIGAAKWGGAVFLLAYGALAAWRALRPTRPVLDPETAPIPVVLDEPADHGTGGSTAGRTTTLTAAPSTRKTLLPVLLTCLALTWLNPHVYLDTVILLGSVAATHGDLRWWFGAGAVAASLIWFTVLTVGARLLSGWLATPRAWRIVDGSIAVVMVMIAVGLIAST